MNKNLDFQQLTTIGYLFLIALGLINEVVFYALLGIDILNYSSISDVILSPITTLLKDYRVLIAFLASGVLGYVLITKQVRTNDQSENGQPATILKKAITILSVFSMLLLGYNFGAATKLRHRIEHKNLKVNTSILYTDGAITNGHVIGQNSNYIFFVSPDETIITIGVLSNIKEIKKLQ